MNYVFYANIAQEPWYLVAMPSSNADDAQCYFLWRREWVFREASLSPVPSNYCLIF